MADEPSLRRALSFFVDGGKNKRIVLFDSKTIAMRCNARQPLHGHSITVHPEILGLTSSDRVPVSRSGRFNKQVDDMFDVPSLPGVQVEILFWISATRPHPSAALDARDDVGNAKLVVIRG